MKPGLPVLLLVLAAAGVAGWLAWPEQDPGASPEAVDMKPTAAASVSQASAAPSSVADAGRGAKGGDADRRLEAPAVPSHERFTDPPALRAGLASRVVGDVLSAVRYVDRCQIAGFASQALHALPVHGPDGEVRPGLERMHEAARSVCVAFEHMPPAERSALVRGAFDRFGLPELALLHHRLGPLGDWSNLVTRADDPLVTAWAATATAMLDDVARRTGDLDALATLSDIHDTGRLGPRDPTLALAYQMAVTRLRPLLAGRTSPRDGELERLLMRELPPTEMDRARAMADTIVTDCCGAQQAAPARASRP